MNPSTKSAARAICSGASVATGDWLIFIDADSHPSAALFEDVAAQIATGQCLAGGSTVRLEAGYPQRQHHHRTLEPGTSRTLRWMAGSFIFCNAAAFRKLGGFNIELFATEELELSKRLKKLARAEHKRIVILHRHSILTSARKLRLYTPREHFKFMTRTILGGGKTLKSREASHLWYDGRR